MRETVLCYILRGDEVLMLHRVKKTQDANREKWIGIGGGLEAGEVPREALLREAKEETGLTLTEYRYRGLIRFYSDRWEDEVMHLYTAEGFWGTLTECDEGVLEWLPRERLFALPMWAGDKIFLTLLFENAPVFALDLRYRGETLQEAVLNGARLQLS